MATIKKKVSELPVATDPTRFDIFGQDKVTGDSAKASMSELVGPTGPAPNMTIVVNAIPHGQNPTVYKTGTDTAPTFTIGFPLAKDGEKPILRKTATALEYRYNETEQWQTLVLLDDLRLKYSDLTYQEKAELKGEKGDTGAKGEKGDQGERGLQGIKGDTGAKGDQGEKGDAGETGPQGLKGDKGEKGDKGDQGERGEDGTSIQILGNYATLAQLQAAHPTGNPGECYTVGTEGDLYVWSEATQEWKFAGRIKGEKGDAGPAGPKGDPGEQGERGLQGEKGDTGATGAAGAKGDTGTSNYLHIRYSANANGNPMSTTPNTYIGLAVTTSATAPTSYASYSWAMFRGQQGDPGPKGDQGDPGPKGDQGDPGPAGGGTYDISWLWTIQESGTCTQEQYDGLLDAVQSSKYMGGPNEAYYHSDTGDIEIQMLRGFGIDLWRYTFWVTSALEVTSEYFDIPTGAGARWAEVSTGAGGNTSFTLEARVFRILSNFARITVSLPPGENDVNEYAFQFTSRSTPTTLVMPSDVKWINEPIIEANKTYQVSIVNKMAVIGGAL